MTSENEALKTNEFLRRRKLRLQQVREQSKDIAKKIRQRAKVEKLRQVVDLDAKKQKEYFECQEKLVKRLEVLYARGLENVGASHQSASELTQRDEVEKTDLSKLRGKEAVAELRRKKQEKLDQQKKLLDRKLQAREAANEISRDKSSVVANKLLSKSPSKKVPEDSPQKAGGSSELANTKEGDKDAEKINNVAEAARTSDMATQWDMETIPHEWEPAVPALALPTDKDTPRNSENYGGSKSDKNKKLDLFALSEEMPSSLRGKHTHDTKDREPGRPSLTIVSEYLQNRKMRLREAEPTNSNKRTPDDMQSLKQTIQRTRSANPEAPGKGPPTNDKVKNTLDLQRKSSILMYNHMTKGTRDLPYDDDKLVVRDQQSEEDAYSQAMKAVSALGVDKDPYRKVQDMRNRVAVTKQNVEKEYKDTINFLNSLPKDKSSKVIKNAYMDEHRLQMQHEHRQQKMQQEYKKIEKECKKHNCLKNRNQPKPSAKQDINDNFDSRDFQYSWMPVPESDGNLAIHAIPNTVKHGKSGNSVKFSKVDSYHEYRSRHKHTPPTKDTAQEKPYKKKLDAVVIDKNTTESSEDSSSVTSDTSSVENLRINSKRKHKNVEEINQSLTHAERIIIYKVLDSKTEKKTKRQTKLLNEIAKSLTCIEKAQKTVDEDDGQETRKTNLTRMANKSADNPVAFEQLNEGIYKMVEEQGDNVATMYFQDHDKPADAQTGDVHTHPCDCKNQCKSQHTDRGTVLQWESTECHVPPPKPNESQCPSVSNEKAGKHPQVTPTSTATSTASYKTAANEKAGASEGGYIKLVDETGQEAGKFFIGSTAFANNNAYEVIIQLRKKDGSPQEKKLVDNTVQSVSNQAKPSDSETNSSNVKNRPATTETDVNNVQPASETNLCEILSYRSDINKKSTVIPPQPEPTNTTLLPDELNVQSDNKEKHHCETITEECENMRLVQSATDNKDMCDKSMHANLNAVPKSDAPRRSSTTTYTQTSSSSPNHRPVFFHMSSSTSTAYMSPPELILPKFLRPDCGGVTEDETYDPVHTAKQTEKDYCEEYMGCAQKFKGNKISSHAYNIKSKYDNIKIITPPNSAVNDSEVRHDPRDDLEERNVSRKGATTDKQKCTHHKRRNMDSTKRHCHSSSRHINMRIGVDATSRKKKYKSSNFRRDKKSDSTNLNPIIKNYVNKLLTLNREGLKAVEVAEQECSSIGTPGSSIINVPFNVDERRTSLQPTISLEQIKNLLIKQIIDEQVAKKTNYPQNSFVYSMSQNKNNAKYSSSRKKPLHKVKSLNISKQLLKNNTRGEERINKPAPHTSIKGNTKSRIPQSSTEGSIKHRATLSSPEGNPRMKPSGSHSVKKSRSKSSPTPRQMCTSEPGSRYNDSDSTTKNSTATEKAFGHRKKRSRTTEQSKGVYPVLLQDKSDLKSHRLKRLPSHRATATESSVDTSTEDLQRLKKTTDVRASMSTQTTQSKPINTDANLMKLAEDKLHNMEKIADLTEKCTKRLSNLAKVLEEVRKNKSLVYSQISSAESVDSHTDHKSDKPVASPIPFDPDNGPQRVETKSPELIPNRETTVENDRSQFGYITVLTDIPKPVFKAPEPVIPSTQPKSADKLDSPLQLLSNTAEMVVKTRPKPPPALSRRKHGQDYIIPHELSTVIEVDSPMSVKHKNQSARNDAQEAAYDSNKSSPVNFNTEDYKNCGDRKESTVNPDLLQVDSHFTKKYKTPSESSDDSKFQMLDLKQFNEIMLEPFLSIQEYAKQYNIEPPEEGSNLEDIQKHDAIVDDMSSLHSDGSLPDVIAELLKRNIITEPFKFDTGSNINSTTISSESTLSMLALSKARRDRKRSKVLFQSKENIGETSDTLSISSNPDLENAFKKLGMGWASSTLKKTKERLALSSSSNTSSSSLSQFKIKSFEEKIPLLVTDSASSGVNISKSTQNKNNIDNSKNAEQQTTLSNSMTVKEFLRNELAKKITFTNKSQEEFVSLFETKMPEEMKDTSQVNRGEHSFDSARSAANRARTSTPVQLFKSITYHSSSSSNVSNGLFSNADDLSSVKMTSNSIKNHSTSDKDDLTIPNFSLRIKKSSDCSKSD